MTCAARGGGGKGKGGGCSHMPELSETLAVKTKLFDYDVI